MSQWGRSAFRWFASPTSTEPKLSGFSTTAPSTHSLCSCPAADSHPDWNAGTNCSPTHVSEFATPATGTSRHAGMRDSEIQELTRDSHTTKDGLAALRSIQHKGNEDPAGLRQTWWAPRPVIRTVEVLGNLARHDTHLFARSSSNTGAYAPSRDIARLIAFVNDDPARRPGRGRGLGLEHVVIPNGQAINATSLRRSFRVFATTRPGAELGLGIQLGRMRHG